MTNELRRSWLIQRLRRPVGYELSTTSSGPFAFGGGLRDGGLSPEALEIFRELFRFDYMGAAEFEFGAVPEAFQKIAGFAEAGVLSYRAIEIQLSDVMPDHRSIPKRAKIETRSHWKMDGSAMVWLLAPAAWHDELEERIRDWATVRWDAKLKKSTKLAAALRPETEYELEDRERGLNTNGWLELDNGFMFFTHRDMFLGTAKLFGVDVSAETAAADEPSDDVA